jgi:acetyl esterase
MARAKRGEGMPVDPKVKDLLDRMQQMGMRPLSGMFPEEGRRMILNTMRQPPRPVPVGSVIDRVIPGPGGDLPVRVYRPRGTGPFPVIIFLGVIGQAQETMDYACLWLKYLFSVKISEKDGREEK